MTRDQFAHSMVGIVALGTAGLVLWKYFWTPAAAIIQSSDVLTDESQATGSALPYDGSLPFYTELEQAPMFTIPNYLSYNVPPLRGLSTGKAVPPIVQGNNIPFGTSCNACDITSQMMVPRL